MLFVHILTGMFGLIDSGEISVIYVNSKTREHQDTAIKKTKSEYYSLMNHFG